jgi:hypothetical protein
MNSNREKATRSESSGTNPEKELYFPWHQSYHIGSMCCPRLYDVT